MLHIIKTGGESLETYLNGQPSPNLDFSTCRKSAMSTGWTANMSASPACLAGATVVSSALCGLNCECCAADVRLPPGEAGFHGTLLRSPRAHALSLFSHGHVAHFTTWRRMASDFTLYLAEGLLRLTEYSCGSYCAGEVSACFNFRVYGWARPPT